MKCQLRASTAVEVGAVKMHLYWNGLKLEWRWVQSFTFSVKLLISQRALRKNLGKHQHIGSLKTLITEGEPQDALWDCRDLLQLLWLCFAVVSLPHPTTAAPFFRFAFQVFLMARCVICQPWAGFEQLLLLMILCLSRFIGSFGTVVLREANLRMLSPWHKLEFKLLIKCLS